MFTEPVDLEQLSAEFDTQIAKEEAQVEAKAPESVAPVIAETPVTKEIVSQEAPKTEAVSEEVTHEAPDWLTGKTSTSTGGQEQKVEYSAEAKAEIEKYKAEVDSYKKILEEDQFLKAYLSQEDKRAFLKQSIPTGEITIEGKSEEDIHRANVSRFLSGEDVEDEMSRFMSLSKWEQKSVIENDKKSLVDYNKSLEKDFSKYFVDSEEKIQKQKEFEAAFEQKKQFHWNDLNTKVTSLKEKGFNGVKVTDEMANKIIQEVAQHSKADANGDFDIDRQLYASLFITYRNEILEGLADIAAKKREHEVLNGLQRPSKNSPVAKNNRNVDEDAELESDLNAYYDRRKLNLY